jgi:tetratricopeptide (TPR) repeat protein
MRIFISHSSKYRALCERLQLALEANGRHDVFVDRSELTPGQAFDEKIRTAILGCELLLFLVSPESVAAGSYALAELNIAKSRWRHPGHHVLPVKVAPTPQDAIPAYLSAVTILEPQGDVVAETLAAVEARGTRRGRSLALIATVVMLSAAASFAGYAHWQARRVEESAASASALVAQQLCESHDHALAWQHYAAAIARHTLHVPLRRGREDCAMRWLREIHVDGIKETFTGIVSRVLPVLTEGMASASRQRAADLMAHLGWADQLRVREGAYQLDPEARYAKALELDPRNVFAHVMWGHHILMNQGRLEDAKAHFEAALASDRERAFVRELQLAALTSEQDVAGIVEAARMANDMRKGGEKLDAAERHRLWTYVYQAGLMRPQNRAEVMTALRDPDHAATFLWLYGEGQRDPNSGTQTRFILASLAEASGARDAARARYEAVRDELVRVRSSGSMLDETNAALERLQDR